MKLPPLPLVDGALLLDNSTLEQLRCPRLLEYQWLRKRVLAANKAGRNFGSTLHAGWSVRFRECGSKPVPPEVFNRQQEAMRKYLEENPQPSDDFRNFNHACTVMSVYNHVYQTEPYKILPDSNGSPLIEKSFMFPFGKFAGIPIYYTGKLDMGIENNDGIWSQDHKTAFQFGDTFDSQMQMDGGQLGYCWALRETLGKMPNGYIIDAVRIRRPKRDDEYTGNVPVDGTDFKRMPFWITPDTLDEWREDTIALINDVLQYHAGNYFPRHRWQCTNKFGKCDMFDVCSLPRQQREGALASNMYEDNTWSPLNKPSYD